MKHALTILSLLAVAGLSADAPAPTQVGRFQLLAAEVDTYGKNSEPRRERALFRIDTTTGETWQYGSGAWPVKSNLWLPYSGWVRLEESLADSFQAVMRASLEANQRTNQAPQTPEAK